MSAERRLKQLRAAIPDIGCKGLCAASCGPIGIFPVEQGAVSQAAGFHVGEHFAVDADLNCPMLRDGKCSIYTDRPLLCRVWGAVDAPRIRCPFGCEPKLSAEQGAEIMRKAAQA